MKKDEIKRYLITYTDGTITSSKASSLLGITKTKMKEGVSFMETDATPGKEDILHFENVGITSIELTSEEVDKLSKKEGILAVEEDTEMHALGFTPEEGFNNTFENAFDMSQLQSDMDSGSYTEGYNKALLDMFSAMLKLKDKPSAGETSLITGEAPIMPMAQPIPWNINMVRAPWAWARGINGSGIKVAVLDTGIAAHSDLAIYGGASFIPGVTSFNDGHGHGTHCAGIIGARNNMVGVVGVAPLCQLYAVKVLSDSGSGSSSWIIAGMEWCTTHGIKVISMSLGSKSNPSTAWAQAIRHCQQDHGITVVCAAGNSYNDPPPPFPWVNAPANSIISGNPYGSPIAVGAVDINRVIAYFSSRGARVPFWNHVTVVAPGVNIYSTYKGGGYATMSGTSMACPHVAGLAALVRQRYAGIPPLSVKTRIATTATNLGPIGFDITYGYGLIDCYRATL